MDTILLEVRFAIRRLLAQPGFSAIAVLSLAIGIGATTVFFSMMNSTLLKPLPVERPQELFSLVNPAFGAPVESYPNYRDIRDRNTVFSTVMAYRIVPAHASLGGGQNSRMWGYLVSGNYFSTLGVQAVAGRVLTEDDDRKMGGHPVAVISHACWQRRFGGRPDIAGRSIKLNGMSYTILGVTPPGFEGTERFYAPEIFVPMTMTSQIEPGATYLESRGSQNTFLLGRLKPGVTRQQAEANLNAVAAQLAREHPKENEGLHYKLVEPGWVGDFLRGGIIGFTSVLVAGAGLLLLVVCVNLASLLLARAAERRKETAVRLAIGASRWQLIRQLLIESLVLSSAGGGAGLLVAMWGVDFISKVKPPIDFALSTMVAIDYRVLLFTMGVTMLASLLLGMAPAWQSARTDLTAALKNEDDPRRRRWPLRDLLVGAQIALSVLLLAASGLVLESLRKAMQINLGFNPHGAITMGFDLALQGYSNERGMEFQKRLMARLRSLPGVESAAFGGALPLDLEISNNSVYEDGQPEPPTSKMPSAQVYRISPDFLRTLQTNILAGREFEERDGSKEKRAVVINRTLASTVLKMSAREAIGKRLRVNSNVWEVVGVVEDGKYLNLAEQPKPVMFFPNNRNHESSTRLVVRTATDVHQLLARVRQIVSEMDADLPIYRAETLEDHLNLPLLPSRLAAGALSVFGAVTMLLAAIGIYGVMAFSVARRTREIGIRMAIGASPWQMARVLLKRAAWLVGVAAVAGVVLAMFAAGLLAPVLMGVNPRDPLVYAVGVLLISAVAFVACWQPARRAMHIDPLTALRQD